MQSSQWHYVLARTRGQHGPVDEVELDRLIASGMLHATDYVWTAGMADWARAETVPALVPRFNAVRNAAPAAVVVLAGFWRRAGALAVDAMLLAVMWAAATGALWYAVRTWSHETAPWPRVLASTATGLPVGALVYYLLFEGTRRHTTPGKRVFRLTVTGCDGRPPSFGQVLARNAFKVLSFATGLMGFTLAAFTERKQALHDVLSRTLVVRS